MKLTPRLLTVANKVRKGAAVADVGTDHGYVPVYLIRNKVATKVIATDVNEGPLASAQKTISLYGLCSQIETRLGSGLETIKPKEVDTVIIAGMGGLLIRDILIQSPEVTKTTGQFILQPMVAQADLRHWLVHNGFKITNEQLAKEEHRIYEIIVAEPGEQKIEEDIYFEIGNKLIENRDPLLMEFINKHIKKQNDIIHSLKGQQSETAMLKYEECRRKLEKLEEVLKCL